MVADSNSQVAWHRAQIRKHREALKLAESARFTVVGEMAGSKAIGLGRKTVAELTRKIRESERVVAAHERQTRRPLATDFKTLVNAPWSRWNGSDSSNLR